jgi:PAS domain S-box-containing protein
VAVRNESDQLLRRNQALLNTLSMLGTRLDGSIQLLSVISSLTSIPLKAASLAEAAQEILETLTRDLTDVDASSLLLYDADEDRLNLLEARGQADLLGESEGPYNRDLTFKPGEGIAGRVFAENRPRYWDRESIGMELLKIDPGLSTPESLASLPLVAHTGKIGVINISFGQPRPFDHARKRDLTLLSSVVANIIQTFILKEDLSRTADHLLSKVSECELEIKERQLTEEALKESEETSRVLLNTPLDSLLLLDPDGYIIFLNQVAADRIGQGLDTLIDTAYFDYLPEEVAEPRRRQARRVIATGQPVGFIDQHAALIFENHIFPIFDSAGQVGRLVFWEHDITEAKKSEAKLLQDNKHLETLVIELRKELDKTRQEQT